VNLASAQAPLYEIHVTGNDQLSPAAIIAASGLRIAQTVTRDDFDAANQKLFDTGFFTSVNYRYGAKTEKNVIGFTLTFQVTEEPALTEVTIDIPGVDETRLWQDLARAGPFIRPRMPQNERAIAYYQHAIEAWLRQNKRTNQIIMRDESDLDRGTMAVVFLPANLPKIAEVLFSGNQVLDNRVLESAIATVAPGQDYTDRSFRRILELNVRPLYEENGRLSVSFPNISLVDPSASTSNVNVEIAEGPAWTLGKVTLSGASEDLLNSAAFPQGKLANWKQIEASITTLERSLKRSGYLNVAAKPVRSFHDSASVVDLTVQIDKGVQFFFASLQITGFAPDLEPKARKLWKLKTGAPMDEPYITEYIHSVLDTFKIPVNSVSNSLNIRPGTNQIDVILAFR
jgi:outer membrane protein assembly factor BamA